MLLHVIEEEGEIEESRKDKTKHLRRKRITVKEILLHNKKEKRSKKGTFERQKTRRKKNTNERQTRNLKKLKEAKKRYEEARKRKEKKNPQKTS